MERGLEGMMGLRNDELGEGVDPDAVHLLSAVVDGSRHFSILVLSVWDSLELDKGLRNLGRREPRRGEV